MADDTRAAALPVGLAVAAMVALGVVFGRGRTRKERATPAERQAALVAYLREHLTGADLAVRVVERLRRTQASLDDRQFFDWLFKQIEADREVVRALLRSLGSSPRSPKRLLGQASGSVLKLMAGGAKGELSLFRTMEALAIGVQGKRCLWRALEPLQPGLPLPAGKSLSELESSAVRQWEAIEERRQTLVRQTFAAG
jgi:hypothetical protein